MRYLPAPIRAGALLAALALFSGPLLFASSESGYTPLIAGDDMSAFELVGTPASTWTVEGDIICCTGEPRGYIATRKSFRSFVLKLDFRYERPANLKEDASFKGNSGVLLHITGEHKVWPQCIEVQGQHTGAGRILAIGGAAKVPTRDDPEARRRALHPVGEWNSLEITSREGAFTALLNGVEVCASEAGELREGPIGFQSEGAPIDFRDIRIKILP